MGGSPPLSYPAAGSPLAHRYPAYVAVLRAFARALHERGADQADIEEMLRLALREELARARFREGRTAAATSHGVVPRSVERACAAHGDAERAALLREAARHVFDVVNDAGERLTVDEILAEMRSRGLVGPDILEVDVEGLCVELVAADKLREHARAGGRKPHYSVEGVDLVRWPAASKDEAIRNVTASIVTYLEAALRHTEALQLGWVPVPAGPAPDPRYDGSQVRTLRARTLREPAAVRRQLAHLLEAFFTDLDRERLADPAAPSHELAFSLGIHLTDTTHA